MFANTQSKNIIIFIFSIYRNQIFPNNPHIQPTKRTIKEKSAKNTTNFQSSHEQKQHTKPPTFDLADKKEPKPYRKKNAINNTTVTSYARSENAFCIQELRN